MRYHDPSCDPEPTLWYDPTLWCDPTLGGRDPDATQRQFPMVHSNEGAEMLPCTSEVLLPSLRAALEQRNDDEEQQLESGALVPAFTRHLRVSQKNMCMIGGGLWNQR